MNKKPKKSKKPPPDLPFPDSYWVVPGQFLAGEYPASRYFEEETRNKLRCLISVNVSSIIDLTSPEEVDSYEELWRDEAYDYGIDADYTNYQIEGQETPPEEEMVKILDKIDQDIEAGKVVYVHCYAGIGRTGLVVGCHLARHGCDGKAALKRLAELRENTPNYWMKSPESSAQELMVKSWPKGK